MMHRASGLLALVTLALVAPGTARTLHAADDDLVQQFTTVVTLPTQPGEEDDRLAGDTQAVQPLLLTQDKVPTLVMPQSAPADRDVGTPAPFLLDLSPETETFSMDPDTSHQYDAPAERSWEPHNFEISDSLKVKAQPIGGGMGGRVTLTYSFTSGY